jgi:hypothetical protein
MGASAELVATSRLAHSNNGSVGFIRPLLSESDFTVRRVLSLSGLSGAVWVSYLALEGMLAGIVAVVGWHPHFRLATPMLALVFIAGLALIAGASWRIVRGPDRRRALSCLLIGAAPLWFLAVHFLRGAAAISTRNYPPDPVLRLLDPLGESVMDLEARFRYPQRTYGEKVVMISSPMPEVQARAQVTAMDRHIRELEARLGRPTGWTIRWVRGPLLGMQGAAFNDLCMGSLPGESWEDAEGLAPTDRHEVAHCVLTSHCPALFDAPAVLVEGWAESNMGYDVIVQAKVLKEQFDRGNGITLCQFTGANWYHRHQAPAYGYGAPLVNYLLHRFGPEKFIELYTTCSPSTFEADCRRILGLDLDGLDAALRAEIDQLIAETGSLDRYQLEHLELDPSINAAEWKAFLAEYFAATDRILALYRQVRVTAVGNRSTTIAGGQTKNSPYEDRTLRSGEFASLRHKTPDFEIARLSQPRRSIEARRDETDRTWQVEDESKRSPEQSRRHALYLIDLLDAAGCWSVAPLVNLSRDLNRFNGFVVAGLERFTENGRPRVRVRIEDRAPADWSDDFRSKTFVLAADDIYATLSTQFEDASRGVYQSEFTYDRHEGLPALRSVHATTTVPDGTHKTFDMKFVERRFGPVPEEEFDPGRFLDGPQTTITDPDFYTDEPSTLGRFSWLPLPIGALCLVTGAAISIATRRTAP